MPCHLLHVFIKFQFDISKQVEKSWNVGWVDRWTGPNELNDYCWLTILANLSTWALVAVFKIGLQTCKLAVVLNLATHCPSWMVEPYREWCWNTAQRWFSKCSIAIKALLCSSDFRVVMSFYEKSMFNRHWSEDLCYLGAHTDQNLRVRWRHGRNACVALCYILSSQGDHQK